MTHEEDLWRRKSDEELQEAARVLHEYTGEGRKVILAELSRRSLNFDVAHAELAPESADDVSSPTQRYRDAYRIAASVVSIGAAIKFLGFASVIVLVAFSQLQGSILLGAVLFGILAGLAFWVAGDVHKSSRWGESNGCLTPH
jgi:hypothetical protein